MTVSNDPILLSDQARILSIVSKDTSTYRNGSPPSGCLFAKYENHNGPDSSTVWVANERGDMNKLTYLVRALMGDVDVPVDEMINPSRDQNETEYKKQQAEVVTTIRDIKNQRNQQAHSAAPKGGASSMPAYLVP